MEMETRRFTYNLTQSTINDFNGRICATLIIMSLSPRISTNIRIRTELSNQMEMETRGLLNNS